MAAGVTYVIAGYAGKRNGIDAAYNADRFCYLKRHVQVLCDLRHSLDEIIVVLNCDHPSDADGLELPKYAGNTQVRVETRPNIGISYGAMAHGTKLASSEFVMLFEDDYVVTVDDAPTYMLERFLAIPKCGMLCAATGPWPGSKARIAGVFLGISRRQTILDHVVTKGGVIPHKDYARAWYAQVTWSQCLAKAGLVIEDWCDDYASSFWESQKSQVNWYHGETSNDGPNSGPRGDDPYQDTSVRTLVVPLQAVNRVVPVRIGPRMISARIDERGYLHQ